MTIPKRLFDAIPYQLKNASKSDTLVSKIDGKWTPYGTGEVQNIVNKLSAGLLRLGVSANDFTDEGCDKVAIISANRPEWVITDIAVQQLGALLTPVYPTTSEHELIYIFNHAAVKYVFVDSRSLYKKVKEISDEIPSLKGIFTFDRVEDATHWTTITENVTEESLQKVEEIKKTITEDHAATIIYTSGTTGIPKGVVLTHKNILSNIFLAKKFFPIGLLPTFKAISILPLNHIFEKMLVYVNLFSAISIYFPESLDTIGENIKEIKPQTFVAVPRLLEKMYEKIIGAGNKLTGVKRKLFFWALKLTDKYDSVTKGSIWYRIQLAVADKFIFAKWREALGGNLDYVIVGGAACPPKILRAFNAAGIPLYEGYGPTENSPVIAVNRRRPAINRFGTVGECVEGIEVRLEEDGEICVKGPTVMKGYYKEPQLTTETVIDGWLHTGDIGVWVEKIHLKIIDRKKELFKTSGGKYVAPQPIETKLRESLFIDQVLIVGPERKYVGALIIPNFQELKKWMATEGILFTNHKEAVANVQVKALFRSIIQDCNKDLNQVEQIKKIEFLTEDWSVTTGELTPKLSVKRKVVMDKYKDTIDLMY